MSRTASVLVRIDRTANTVTLIVTGEPTLTDHQELIRMVERARTLFPDTTVTVDFDSGRPYHDRGARMFSGRAGALRQDREVTCLRWVLLDDQHDGGAVEQITVAAGKVQGLVHAGIDLQNPDVPTRAEGAPPQRVHRDTSSGKDLMPRSSLLGGEGIVHRDPDQR